MAFKTYEELEEAARKAGQSWSDADKNLAKQNLDYGNSIFTYKSDWQNAWNRGDKESAAAIHDQTENFRKQFGNYSGGADGSGYIKDTTYFNYDDPYKDTLDDLANQLVGYGKFQNPYQEQTDKVLQEFLGRDPFSYDPSTDPIWGQYQKTYLREGQRAREDTLGNMAAATGGQTSTAAVHAASQAQDYYNAQMADKIPELYQLAYEMYQGQGNDYLNQINALRGLGSDALNAWNANLGLLNSQLSGVQGISDDLYNRAYNKYAADYQANRDAISDTRYREETAYNKQLNQYEMDQNAQKQAREQALKWLAMGIMPSDGVIERSGLDPQDVASYLDAVQTKAALKSGGSGKSSRSSSSGSGASALSGSMTEEERLDALYRDARASANPQNYIATHYKEYGFSKSTGLSSGYTSWEKLPAGKQEVASSAVANQSGSTWVYVPGLGRLSWSELEHYVDTGKVKETKGSDGKYRYTLAR